MIWWILKNHISITLFVYFKRIAIRGREHIKKKGPAIIALNHPNAFMDPSAFTLVIYPVRTYYLARGDAFKPGLATFLLESLGIVPIYRIQDAGKEGLKKNDETYKRVNHHLSRKKNVLIFAEGLCIQERRLRPLKKGVSRMVFGAMDAIKDPDLVVIPVGCNYSEPSKFRSTLFFNIGEPIRVADYMERYKEHPAKTMNVFIQDLEPKMRELITHINNPDNDKIVPQLEKMYMRDICKDMKLDPEDPAQAFEVSKYITELVNQADLKQKPALEELKQKVNVYFKGLDELKIRDWLIDPKNAKKISWSNFIFRSLLLIIFFPVYLRGLLGSYIPYKITEKITSKTVKNIEFLASFNLGIGSFLFLFFYVIQFFIAYAFSPHIGWPLLVVLISILTAIFCLYYHPFMKKTIGLYRVLKNKMKASNLRHQRKEIDDLVGILNKNL
jgi:glycerol-3-phosphate O-acyltransferase / dihydroxyacetone phosphate acyltransferase